MNKKSMSYALILVVILFCTPAYAQTWHTANQFTLGWDPVPLAEPSDQPNKYQVYTRTDLVSSGTPVGGEITATQMVITLSTQGRRFFGVETIRYPAGETVGFKSATKAWSNVAADCGPDGPFGVVYFVAPPAPGGLRRVP